MKQHEKGASHFWWGFFAIVSAKLCWVLRRSLFAGEELSSWAWRVKGDDPRCHDRINWFFRKLFKQEDHCGLVVLGNIEQYREYLAQPGIDHVVLNAEEAAEWRAYLEAKA